MEASNLLLHQSIFPLEYVKRHVQSLQKGSEADLCVFQNLMWLGVYLRITFSNNLLHKVLTLVPLTETEPEVFFPTMATFIYGSNDALE